jgi:D-alanyl-D-alanine carboxypeptidase
VAALIGTALAAVAAALVAAVSFLQGAAAAVHGSPQPQATVSDAQGAAIYGLVTSTLASNHIAGATVAVWRGGSPLFQMSYGFTDVGARHAAALDTIYPIGSITKQFTAACVLMLAEQGKLAIDDPLSKFVPDLPWADRVTLRHLLDQESGIVDYRAGAIDTTQPLTPASVVDKLKLTDLLFPPGSKYEYSNSNYYLLGMVVEKASGMTYPDFLAKRIFVPLGLKSTSYGWPPSLAKRIALPYVSAAGGLQAATAENADWSFAAGAISTTAADLARWDDALRAGKVIGAESLHEMMSPGVLDDGDVTDYAMGWVVVKHDHNREIWHNGEVTGYHAMNVMYPDAGIDVIVLTNTGGMFAADALAVQIFDLIHPFQPTASDVAVRDRAKEWLGRIIRGDVDRTQVTDALSAVLTDATVKSAGDQLKAYGALKSISLDAVDQDASGRSYGFRMAFAKQKIRWVMGIDATGKISALSFRI